MGKYINNGSSLSSSPLIEESLKVPQKPNNTVAIPEATKSISAEDVATLNNYIEMPEIETNAENDKIIALSKQNEELRQILSEITKKMNDQNSIPFIKQELEATVKEFSGLQIFERLNQIFVMHLETNRKMEILEEKFNKLIDILNTSQTVIRNSSLEINESSLSVVDEIPNENFTLSPRELYELSLEKKGESIADFNNIETSRKFISEMKSGVVPTIPMDELVDDSIILEDAFPGLDPEAYSAAYKSMEKSKDLLKQTIYTESKKSEDKPWLKY